MAEKEYYIGDRGPYFVDDASDEFNNEGQLIRREELEAAATSLTDHIADTSTHGVSGDIVGTGDTQYLTNKKFGAGSNYADFSASGTLKLHGTATTFVDLLGSAASVKVQGTGVAINDAEQTIAFANNANLSDYAWVSYQMYHQWLLGSVVGPHIHIEQTSSAVPNMLMQYRWQRQKLAKTTAWTNYLCNTPVETYVSGTLNQILRGAGITPPTGYDLSDILQFRVLRDNANTSTLFAGTDTAPANVSVVSIDIHIEIDDLGSNTEFAK